MNNQQGHREEMDNCVHTWLASHLSTGNDHRSVSWVREMLREQRVTTFLLVWPIMEHQCFRHYSKRDNKPEKFSNDHTDLYPTINVDGAIDSMIEHFHKRFGGNNNQQFNSLASGESVPSCIRSFFENDAATNNSNDKLKLHVMLYIAQRYRNNLFHGNKLFESWTKVSDELDYCITFMMRLVDAHIQKPK